LRAGLTFPVGRIHTLIIVELRKNRLGSSAAINAAAVLEYLVAETL
jgi:hypothetical protein